MIRLCGKDIELEYISQNLSQSNQCLVRPSIYLIMHILKILFCYPESQSRSNKTQGVASNNCK
jgi:hypothetical protein